MHALLPAMLQSPAPTGGPPSGFITLWYILGFGAIMYFFFIRPQKRQQDQHKQLVASLQKGDQVLTSGGVLGEIVYLKDNEVTIRSGEAKLIVARGNVTSVLNRPAAEAKKA